MHEMHELMQEPIACQGSAPGNLSGDALTLPARIMAVADVYDALLAKRPYRDALEPEAVLARDVPHGLCATVFDGLKHWMDYAPQALN
jgi:hypothetical protein